MDNKLEVSEIVLEDIYTDNLPSLEDLMKEFEAEDVAAPEETAAVDGIRVVSNSETTAPETEVLSIENNISNLKVEKLGRENRELTALLARTQSDFDNFRRRVERERGEHYAFAVSSVVKELLPVLDNFRLALTSMENSPSPELHHFFEGFELISQQFEKVLQTLGVEPVSAVGEAFDPHFHEAVSTEQNGEVPPNTILEELVRGYRMGEKLVRPAIVKVSVRDEG